MSEQGKQISDCLRGVQDFYSEVAKLLKAGTSTMVDSGWAVARSAACGSDGSKAIGFPRYWLPEDAFQFYRKKNDALRVAYIAVVFGDVRKPETVTEPFATAGWIKHAQDNEASNGGFLSRWCRLSLDFDTVLRLDGSWVDIAPEDIDAKGAYQIDQARTRACRLTEIEGESELNDLIVKPLLNDLSKHGYELG